MGRQDLRFGRRPQGLAVHSLPEQGILWADPELPFLKVLSQD